MNFDQTQLYEITTIDREASRISVEGQTDNDVPVGFWVKDDGTSEVWYNEDQEKMGELRRAEVPAKDLVYIR